MEQFFKDAQQVEKFLPLSYSKAQSILSCPQKYFWTYIDKQPQSTPRNPSAAIVGKFLHSVLSLYITRLKAFPEQTKEDFFHLAEKALVSSGLTVQEKQTASGMFESSAEVAVRVTRALLRHQMRVYSEVGFCIPLTGAAHLGVGPWKSRGFYGYIDLLAVSPDKTSGMLLDFKSHQAPEGTDESLLHQLQTYSLHSFRMIPALQKVKVYGAYLPSAEVVQLDEVLRHSHEGGPLLFLQKSLRAAIACAQDGYPPTPGSLCEWCGFTHICSKS